MVIWESGNIARCQICGISSNICPSLFEKTDETAVVYRLIACGHLLDPYPMGLTAKNRRSAKSLSERR